MIQDLLKELLELVDVDEGDLEDFLQDFGQGDEDEDEEFDPDKECDLDTKNIFDDIELIGKSFWKDVSEFGDKARDMATNLILELVQGSIGVTYELPTYKSRPLEGKDFFDVDIDATIEAKVEDPLEQTVPWVYERQRSRNPVLLLMDTSFSMNGLKIMIAGITVGVLSRLLPSKDLCVIGFNKSPYYIKQFDEEITTYAMVNRIMNLVPRGYTNLSEALILGSKLLYPYQPFGKLILLTDADPTAGKNPIPEASKLQQLDLMLFPEGNLWLAKKLIYEVFSGKLYKIYNYSDIPKIITKIFES